MIFVKISREYGGVASSGRDALFTFDLNFDFSGGRLFVGVEMISGRCFKFLRLWDVRDSVGDFSKAVKTAVSRFSCFRVFAFGRCFLGSRSRILYFRFLMSFF